MLIALYVEDIVLATNDLDILEKEKAHMKEQFEMDDRGEIHYGLGRSIKRNGAERIHGITQNGCLKDALKQVNMQYCKPVSTSMEMGIKYERLKDGEEQANVKDYHATIGSLRHAAIAIRPDISFAVRILSQYCFEPRTNTFKGS